MVVYDCDWNPANVSNVITTATTSSEFISKLSVSYFWSPKFPISWKMRPHSGSCFLYCPRTCHLLIQIDYNQRKLRRNDPKSSNFRLQSTQIITQSSCLKWSRIRHKSVRIHRKSTRIVSYVSNSPQTRRNSPWKLSNRLQFVSQSSPNCRKKLMTHPLVSRRTAMP